MRRSKSTTRPPTGWKEGSTIPEGRRRGGAGCVLHDDGWIYLVGGIVDGHHAGSQAWLDRLNPVTGGWEVLPDAPRKRDHAPAAIVDNKMYFLPAEKQDGTTEPIITPCSPTRCLKLMSSTSPHTHGRRCPTRYR